MASPFSKSEANDNVLDQLIAWLDAAPEATRRTVAQQVYADPIGGKMWAPNEGPQSDAYYSKADQLLYGGQAGGGKSDLLIGLATTQHKRSLLLRRLNKEVHFLLDRTEKILGHSKGLNGQDKRWYLPNERLLMFGGCQHPGDERGYKGEPKDLIGIDEASEFLESQVDFLTAWLRSKDPNQRCRLVLATNPPTTVDGEWILRWFAPWLDPQHPLFPYPAGDLLYFERLRDGSFRWETEPFEIDLPSGGKARALSRTFIPSGLTDNPDYSRTDYSARLAALPEELRRRYERGDFTAGAEDDEWQIIPTRHILEAQQRWKDMGGKPPHGSAMTACALDVAQGGPDNNVLSCRYGPFFMPMIVVAGSETPEPSDSAALVVKHRRDQCAVIIDVGGGYGGGVIESLAGNNIKAVRFNGANESKGKAADKSGLEFINKRAEAIWRFREALDPSQFGGSPIALPDDGTLRADLASYRWKLTPRGIQVEDKREMKKRIGRSPDRGDAVIMAWSEGQRALKRNLTGAGSTMESSSWTPQKFAKVRQGPLTRNNRYGEAEDDGGTPPWRR